MIANPFGRSHTTNADNDSISLKYNIKIQLFKQNLLQSLIVILVIKEQKHFQLLLYQIKGHFVDFVSYNQSICSPKLSDN